GIAELTGDVNRFEGKIESRESSRIAIATREAGTLVVAEPRQRMTRTTVSVAIRPEKVKLSRRGPALDATNTVAINRLEGVVTDISYLGGLSTYKIQLHFGATVRSSVAKTARVDIHGISLQP